MDQVRQFGHFPLVVDGPGVWTATGATGIAARLWVRTSDPAAGVSAKPLSRARRLYMSPYVLAVLTGIHPVVEALRAKRPLDRILIARGLAGPRIQEVIDLARESNTPVRFEDRSALDRLSTIKAHQGVIALGAAKQYADLSDVVPHSKLIVVLDGVEDPHNLGAVVRTAHAAGAGAVVIPERRAVGLTDVVAKAAAGALEHLPVVRVGNVNHTLRSLKDMGYFIYGLDERGETSYNKVQWADHSVIVMGAEGHGLHDLVKKNCDMLLRIPMAGQIASLNVSVATGVVLFDWLSRNS